MSTLEEIQQAAKARKFAPVYLLHGDEPFFIDQAEAAIEAHALSEAEKGFNQTIIYGKDAEPLTLLDVLRRYPMMSERQVVILREAQDMKGLSDLATYIQKPLPSTVFVISYKHKKVDMTTKFGKLLKAGATVLEAKKLYDNQVADWITGYARSKKLTLEPAAAALLAEYLGVELSKAANELDKLALNLAPGVAVTTAHVQEYVGISKEYNVYELQKAMALRDLPRLARMQQYFVENSKKNPLIVTIASLYGFFSKVYALHFLKSASDGEKVKALDLRSEWFLKDYKAAAANFTFAQTCEALSLLRQYDLRAKGVDTDLTNTGEEELLKELFFRIMN